MKKILAVALALVSLLAVVAGCGGDKKEAKVERLTPYFWSCSRVVKLAIFFLIFFKVFCNNIIFSP